MPRVSNTTSSLHSQSQSTPASSSSASNSNSSTSASARRTTPLLPNSYLSLKPSPSLATSGEIEFDFFSFEDDHRFDDDDANEKEDATSSSSSTTNLPSPPPPPPSPPPPPPPPPPIQPSISSPPSEKADAIAPPLGLEECSPPSSSSQETTYSSSSSSSASVHKDKPPLPLPKPLPLPQAPPQITAQPPPHPSFQSAPLPSPTKNPTPTQAPTIITPFTQTQESNSNSSNPILPSDPYVILWSKLRQQGWTYKPAPRSNLSVTYYYHFPGTKGGKLGKRGEDWLEGEDEVREFCGKWFGWVEGLAEVEVGEDRANFGRGRKEKKLAEKKVVEKMEKKETVKDKEKKKKGKDKGKGKGKQQEEETNDIKDVEPENSQEDLDRKRLEDRVLNMKPGEKISDIMKELKNSGPATSKPYTKKAKGKKTKNTEVDSDSDDESEDSENDDAPLKQTKQTKPSVTPKKSTLTITQFSKVTHPSLPDLSLTVLSNESSGSLTVGYELADDDVDRLREEGWEGSGVISWTCFSDVFDSFTLSKEDEDDDLFTLEGMHLSERQSIEVYDIETRTVGLVIDVSKSSVSTISPPHKNNTDSSSSSTSSSSSSSWTFTKTRANNLIVLYEGNCKNKQLKTLPTSKLVGARVYSSARHDVGTILRAGPGYIRTFYASSNYEVVKEKVADCILVGTTFEGCVVGDLLSTVDRSDRVGCFVWCEEYPSRAGIVLQDVGKKSCVVRFDKMEIIVNDEMYDGIVKSGGVDVKVVSKKGLVVVKERVGELQDVVTWKYDNVGSAGEDMIDGDEVIEAPAPKSKKKKEKKTAKISVSGSGKVEGKNQRSRIELTPPPVAGGSDQVSRAERSAQRRLTTGKSVDVNGSSSSSSSKKSSASASVKLSSATIDQQKSIVGTLLNESIHELYLSVVHEAMLEIVLSTPPPPPTLPTPPPLEVELPPPISPNRIAALEKCTILAFPDVSKVRDKALHHYTKALRSFEIDTDRLGRETETEALSSSEKLSSCGDLSLHFKRTFEQSSGYFVNMSSKMKANFDGDGVADIFSDAVDEKKDDDDDDDDNENGKKVVTTCPTLAYEHHILTQLLSRTKTEFGKPSNFFPAPQRFTLPISSISDKKSFKSSALGLELKNKPVIGSIMDLIASQLSFGQGCLCEELIAILALEMLKTLSAVHSCGFVHNDLSARSFIMTKSEDGKDGGGIDGCAIVGFGVKAVDLKLLPGVGGVMFGGLGESCLKDFNISSSNSNTPMKSPNPNAGSSSSSSSSSSIPSPLSSSSKAASASKTKSPQITSSLLNCPYSNPSLMRELDTRNGYTIPAPSSTSNQTSTLNFKYEPDLFSIACIIHLLIFGGEPLKVVREEDGRFGMKNQVSRFMKGRIGWGCLFGSLLNPKISIGADGGYVKDGSDEAEWKELAHAVFLLEGLVSNGDRDEKESGFGIDGLEKFLCGGGDQTMRNWLGMIEKEVTEADRELVNNLSLSSAATSSSSSGAGERGDGGVKRKGREWDFFGDKHMLDVRQEEMKRKDREVRERTGEVKRRETEVTSKLSALKKQEEGNCKAIADAEVVLKREGGLEGREEAVEGREREIRTRERELVERETGFMVRLKKLFGFAKSEGFLEGKEGGESIGKKRSRDEGECEGEDEGAEVARVSSKRTSFESGSSSSSQQPKTPGILNNRNSAKGFMETPVDGRLGGGVSNKTSITPFSN